MFTLLDHWLALLTGGGIVFALGLWERKRVKNISFPGYVALIATATLPASYLSWLDEHELRVKADQAGDRPWIKVDPQVERALDLRSGWLVVPVSYNLSYQLGFLDTKTGGLSLAIDITNAIPKDRIKLFPGVIRSN
jgi:hypothetical protein